MTGYEELIPAAMEVARRISGKVKVRGGRTLHVAGTHQNLPVRVRMSASSHEVDYAVDVRLPEARKRFAVRHVSEPESVYSEFRAGWDAWDIEDAGSLDDQRVYVAEHVCHEGAGDDVEASHHVWQSLPEEFRTHLIELLAGGGGEVVWDGTRLTLDPSDEAALRELVVASMKLLDFGVWLGHGLAQLQTGYR